MKYCSRCGAELVDEAVFCTKCGCAVGTSGQIVTGVSGISQKFLAGLVTLVLGVVGLIYSLVTISSDTTGNGIRHYSYTSPYTNHEIMTIAILIISIVVVIVGLVILIGGKIKSNIKSGTYKKQFKMSRPFKLLLIGGIAFLLIFWAIIFFYCWDSVSFGCNGGNSATFVENVNREAELKRKETEKRIKTISSYFTDSRDGQKYRTVKIGGKTWMAQNLNYKTKSGSWCYNDNTSNCKKYGRLYDWNTAKTECPNGWHLPSLEEWNGLVAASGVDVAGKALKSTSGWNERTDDNGTDDFGFSALPGGSRTADGFYGGGSDGSWWTATEIGSGGAWSMQYYNHVTMFGNIVSIGLSVRCVKTD